jgi:hypothetical protein
LILEEPLEDPTSLPVAEAAIHLPLPIGIIVGLVEGWEGVLLVEGWAIQSATLEVLTNLVFPVVEVEGVPIAMDLAFNNFFQL